MDILFSFHALERVRGRLALSHNDLVDLLDAGLFVNIGQETGNNRVHKLFYSQPDEMCFVAIHDVSTNTLITVLPLDYHANIAWVVSLDAQIQAKDLLASKEGTPKELNEVEEVDKTTSFKIGLQYWNGQNKIKFLYLGSWPSLPYQRDIDRLIQDKKFLEFIDKKYQEKFEKMKSEGDFHLGSLVIKTGKKGKATFISFT